MKTLHKGAQIVFSSKAVSQQSRSGDDAGGDGLQTKYVQPNLCRSGSWKDRLQRTDLGSISNLYLHGSVRLLGGIT